MKIARHDTIIKKLKKTKKPLYLWGCSFVSKKFITNYKKFFSIKGIFDNFYVNENWYNFCVFNPKILNQLKNGVILVHGNHSKEIYNQLKSFNLNKKIEILIDFDNGGKNIINTELYYAVSKKQIQKLDDKSISVSHIVNYYEYNNTKKYKNILIKFDYLNRFCSKKQIEQVLLKYIQKQINKNKLYIGCGEDYKLGYLHCDIRKLPHVDIVCNAWEISSYIKNLNRIYTRHMLEHLTYKEAVYALKDWYKALKEGGEVYIVVPNLNFHCQQWLNAKWNDEELKKIQSNATYGHGGIYGWQRECDPEKKDYNNSYWDVHKTGFNEKNIKYILESVGYKEVRTKIVNDVHLVAEATK